MVLGTAPTGEVFPGEFGAGFGLPCGIGRDEITKLPDRPLAPVRGIVGVDLKRISPRTGAGDDDATGRFSPASAAGELDAIRHFSFDGGSSGQCRAGRTFSTFSQLEPAAAR